MINVVFFHDPNWKIRRYTVEFAKDVPDWTTGKVVESNLLGLLLGTKFALMELKAYRQITDDDYLYDVELLRINKNTEAVLKPLVLAAKEFVKTFPEHISVKEF